MPTTKLLIALPLATPILYLAYLHTTLSRKVTYRTTPYLQQDLQDDLQNDMDLQSDPSLPLPPPLKNNNSREKYIIHHERAQTSLPLSSNHNLKTCSTSEILALYLRHTMSTFSRSPPSWAIWYLLPRAERRTFDIQYIRALDFEAGDRVCGVYVVHSRHPIHNSNSSCEDGTGQGERVVMSLDAPESYSGPVAEGLLTAEIGQDYENGELVFVNHTVMWRETGQGRAGVLESGIGRWVHGVMVRRLMDVGVRGVLRDIGEGKVLCDG